MSCKTVPVSTPEMARRGEIVNSQLAAEPIVGNMTDVESPKGIGKESLMASSPPWNGAGTSSAGRRACSTCTGVGSCQTSSDTPPSLDPQGPRSCGNRATE